MTVKSLSASSYAIKAEWLKVAFTDTQYYYGQNYSNILCIGMTDMPTHRHQRSLGVGNLVDSMISGGQSRPCCMCCSAAEDDASQMAASTVVKHLSSLLRCLLPPLLRNGLRVGDMGP